MSTGPILLPRHREHLRLSGLNDETIRLAGIRSETDSKKIAAMLGWEFPAKSLGSVIVFHYWGQAGPINNVRIRPDNPRVGDDGKSIKYESPVGQDPRPYFPPEARKAATAKGVELFITEGEKKCLAADQLGIPCIGLPGIWAWGQRNPETGEYDLHEDLAEIDWKGRSVRIVPDSDYIENPMVELAVWRLAKKLWDAGAAVEVVLLPARCGGDKVGLDDFLVAEGKSGWERVRSKATVPINPSSIYVLRNQVEVPELGNDCRPSGKMLTIPRAADHILRRAVKMLGGWPKRVNSRLFVEGQNCRPVWLEKKDDLFALLHDAATNVGGLGSSVRWAERSEGAVTKAELFAYAKQNVHAFDSVELFPHHPPVPGAYYMHPEPIRGKASKEFARQLIDRFKPATESDRWLILAFFMTPLWGGPNGGRPAFVFTGKDNDEKAGRGIGKSTIVKMAGYLFGGGLLETNEREDIARLKTRLLSPGADATRIVLLDNLKSSRFSWAEFEGLVTSADISGHDLYHGEGKRPNRLTYAITVNGAAMSKDVAQRSIPIQLARADYSDRWEAETRDLIEHHRWEIIGGLLDLLAGHKNTLTVHTRWGLWGGEVLSRLPSPDKIQRLLLERQAAIDSDDNESCLILAEIRRTLRSWHHDPDTCCVRIRSADIADMVNRATGERLPVNKATARITALGVLCLTPARGEYERGWKYTGPNCPPERAKNGEWVSSPLGGATIEGAADDTDRQE